MIDNNKRYQRQIMLPYIGKEGQERLRKSKLLIVGCGGLGCMLANNMVRAGVGEVRVVDGTRVELEDLHRQILFEEEDAKKKVPKAIAALEKLKRINPLIKIKAGNQVVTEENIKQWAADVDLILDGTDNIPTRFLINRFCVEREIPWIFAGIFGTCGMSMNIIPYETPCLECIFSGVSFSEEPIPVLNTIPQILASIQSTEGIKLLVGDKKNSNQYLLYIDVWENTFRKITVKRRKNCPRCSLNILEGGEEECKQR